MLLLITDRKSHKPFVCAFVNIVLFRGISKKPCGEMSYPAAGKRPGYIKMRAGKIFK